ncbi:hypothetical protein FHU38_000306 [Saccharomonospora amisosensis]|uniref:Uncharacterized protein n=1 Tax=Saccharomonospora amisosensis TaxID=1128677 RepID=A0A7X5UL10_9PSEU|nr:hypothetical protein [Saccharomonospora amisosensis]NIJ09962.1 hypothetical protein [Saccharomonospora amisosensis]
MSAEQLRQSLTEILGAVAEARAHTARAKELLGEFERVVAEVQAQAKPWLPPQLAHAVEQLDTQHGRLDGVTDLLDRYRSRL